MEIEEYKFTLVKEVYNKKRLIELYKETEQISDMFNQMNLLVNEQQNNIDTIEYHIDASNMKIANAEVEIKKAQRADR